MVRCSYTQKAFKSHRLQGNDEATSFCSTYNVIFCNIIQYNAVIQSTCYKFNVAKTHCGTGANYQPTWDRVR